MVKVNGLNYGLEGGVSIKPKSVYTGRLVNPRSYRVQSAPWFARLYNLQISDLTWNVVVC